MKSYNTSSDGLMLQTPGEFYQHKDTDGQGLEEQPPSGWSLTDFGQVSARSRDGSSHATDEVFNSASHLASAMLSILGTVLLISEASATQELADGTRLPVDPWKIVSFSIYGASLIFLFACSTLHHVLVGPMEGFLRMMDYLAIYPLIGGTFTPLCLVFYHRQAIGWAFCCTVWGIALLGMIATATCFTKIPKWLSMTVYVTLGWLGALMSYWLLPVLGWGGFGLFIIGGVFYTAGGCVYSSEHPNPIPGRFGFHEIWHVAVILGAASHWIVMYAYVLPAETTRH
jgi:hemolysin III